MGTAERHLALLVSKYVARPINPLSINELCGFAERTFHGKLTEDCLLKSANWIVKELPVRLAHRVFDFQRLPYAAVSNPHIYQVYQLYANAFKAIHDFGTLTTMNEEESFSEYLKTVIGENSEVVSLMQKGVSQLRSSIPGITLDAFLDRLFVTRIGNRLLTEHHLALHDDLNLQKKVAYETSSSDYVGVVHQKCKPGYMAESIAKKVQEVAYLVYGVAPQMNVSGDVDVEFPYVPEHIRFVLFELLKNSVRASIEHHRHSREIPPVETIICKGKNDIFIKISDRGGGIVPSILDSVFKYGFTTVPESSCSVQCDSRELAGYGLGLPLARLYCRYFGGQLEIKSMPGFGCDTYVSLPRVGNQREMKFLLNRLSEFHTSASSAIYFGGVNGRSRSSSISINR